MDNLRDRNGARALFIGALAILLSAHLLLSLAVSSSFAPDDADQLIFSQTLAAGYYGQPPLYSWLVWLFFHVFGLNRFSYYLLSALVLGSVYVAIYLCAELLAVDGRTRVVAAFSPLLIPTFAWHSFSYLTNTNLVCAAAAGTYYAFLRLRQYGRFRDYTLLGCVLGVGFLSKYNFVLVAGAFLAAAFSLPSFRGRLLNYRILLALAIAALLILPNILWVIEARTALVAELGQKLELMPRAAVAGRITGLLSLFTNLFLILVVPVLIFFSLNRVALRNATEDSQLLLRFFFSALIFLLFLIVAGATHFHERVLQPFTLLVPLFLLMCSPWRTAFARPRLETVLVSIALICAGTRIGQIFFGGLDRGTYPLQMNFLPAANQLSAVAEPGSVIISRDREISGNLRYYLPLARHLCSSRPLYVPELQAFNGRRVLIWNTLDGNKLPTDLRDFARRVLRTDLPSELQVNFVDLPPRLRGRPFNRLGYVAWSK